MDAQWSERLPISKAVGFGGNLEILQASAKSGGYFDNPFVDADGVFRRVPLVQSFEGYLFASLALATAQTHLDASGVELVVETDGSRGGKEYYALENINLGNYRIPVDANGAVFVPYRGRKGSFPYIPAHEVLNLETDPMALKDKVVLVGTSAPGLLDLRSTPVQNIYPGVEVHANIICEYNFRHSRRSYQTQTRLDDRLRIRIADSYRGQHGLATPLVITAAGGSRYSWAYRRCAGRQLYCLEQQFDFTAGEPAAADLAAVHAAYVVWIFHRIPR